MAYAYVKNRQSNFWKPECLNVGKQRQPRMLLTTNYYYLPINSIPDSRARYTGKHNKTNQIRKQKRNKASKRFNYTYINRSAPRERNCKLTLGLHTFTRKNWQAFEYAIIWKSPKLCILNFMMFIGATIWILIVMFPQKQRGIPTQISHYNILPKIFWMSFLAICYVSFLFWQPLMIYLSM